MARKSRLQRKREKESLKQAVKYLFLIFLILFLMVRFGLPALIRMAGFISNLGSSNESIEQQDKLAPMTPRLRPLPEATKSAELNISGYGEEGSTIQLFIRGISADEAVVNKEGEFVFKNIHLREGENEIYTVARNDQGNTSNQSESWLVTVDTTVPEITIDQPKDGEEFFDKDSPITVSGTSEEGVDIRVNGRFVMVKSDGGWETKIELSEGDNQVEVKAVDKAGNETNKLVVVKYRP